MTTESVLASIDWEHNYSVADLHFVHILADFISHLNHLSTEIFTRFRTTLAKRRVAPIKTVLQPLGTNSKQEVENKGMQSTFLDFNKQMGVELEKEQQYSIIGSWGQCITCDSNASQENSSYLAEHLQLFSQCHLHS
jgi:hypothetical protein